MVENAINMAKEQNGSGVIGLLLALVAIGWNVVDSQRSDYQRFEAKIDALESKVDERIGGLAGQIGDMERNEIRREADNKNILHDVNRILSDIGVISDDVGKVRRSMENSSREIMSITWRVASLEKATPGVRVGTTPPVRMDDGSYDDGRGR